ncbi:CCA tRNA nucleotidyltransferase [Thermococci archaeon]|nr:MAG: CCA tRNA nucleotidyltransferase [Thermococci archaeon]
MGSWYGKIERLKKEILKEVYPSKEEREKVELECNRLIQRAKEILGEESLSEVEPKVLGSVARNTYLRGEVDIDLFLLFPLEVPIDELRSRGFRVGEQILSSMGYSTERRYASHPYAHGSKEGIEVDVVPAYKVEHSNEIKTPVDRSVLHHEFLKERIKGLEEEIVLFKAFMKGCGLYGAEAKIGGFSGYLCELLVLRYGDFLSTVEAISKWREGQVVSFPEQRVTTSFSSPLIFPDPTDERRNVAAAVSREKFHEAIFATKLFLDRPSKLFFFPPRRKFSTKELLDNLSKRNLVGILFETSLYIPDLLWPQLRKTLESLSNVLREEGFNVIRSGVWSNERGLALILFELDDFYQKSVVGDEGPPSRVPIDNIVGYITKNLECGPWVEGDRLMGLNIIRRPKSAKFLLNEVISEGRFSGGKHLKKDLIENFDILVSSELINVQDVSLLEWLSDFLRGKPPWLEAWKWSERS